MDFSFELFNGDAENASEELEKLAAKLAMLDSRGFSGEQLADWYEEALDTIEALFVDKEAVRHFREESGFIYIVNMHRGRVLKKTNARRAIGVLRGMAKTTLSRAGKSEMIGETAPKELSDNTKVFIVHGHDEAVREKIETLVTRLGLEAIVLNKKANQGQTIIEKIERHGDVGFAIVAFTPDDIGGSKAEHEDGKLELRPRQNVLLELGYFWGKLGRHRVCLLNAVGDAISSDLRGLGYTSLDAGGAWRIELFKELKAANYQVDANKLID